MMETDTLEEYFKKFYSPVWRFREVHYVHQINLLLKW